MKKKVSLLISALALWLVFAAVIIVGGAVFGKCRLDLTGDRRYTLSPASAQLAQQLRKRLYFRLYVSANLEKYDSQQKRYADYVAEILGKYASLNPQMIKFEVRRFAPYSPSEQNAVKNGIMAEMVDNEPFYLGLTVSGEEGPLEVMPRLLPQRRAYLENDINRILARRENKGLPVIGITSPELPLFGAPVKGKVWSIMPRLAADYQVVEIDADTISIPAKIELMIVQNPSFLPDLYLYALDQYLMRGGKVIMLPDPYSEAEHYYRGYPPAGKNNVAPWLKKYGIVYDGSRAVGDLGRAETAEVLEDGVSRMQPYPFWFFSANDDFSYLHFRTPGALQIEETEGIKYRPLIKTSQQGGSLPVSLLRYAPKGKIITRFKPEPQQYILAVLAEGNFISGYREGALDRTPYQDKLPPFLGWSQNSPSLAVIADSDFLADDAWLYSTDPQNPLYGTVSYASNADFFINLIDHMLGGRQLLAYEEKYSSAAPSIAAVFFEQAASQYAPAIEKLLVSAASAASEADSLAVQVAQSEYGQNLEYRRRLEDISRKLEEDNMQIRRYNYLIKETATSRLNWFMAANLLIYPLLWVALTAVLAMLVRYVAAKKMGKRP